MTGDQRENAAMTLTMEMVSVETARRMVLAEVSPGPTERVRLADSLHRVLAEPVTCDIDYPPFDKALMDGYAVRSAETTSGGGDAQGRVALHVVGQVGAGHCSDRTLGRHETMQINTGAPLPIGADAVVPIEEVEVSEDGRLVRLRCAFAAGRHVEARGRHVSAGSRVLEAGTRLNPARMAVAAAAGAAEVTVYRRPRVAVLVTGDELVDVASRPRDGQIRNSNETMLHAMVRACHAEPCPLGVAVDDETALRTRIERGLQHEVLCLSGGISMGAFDLVPKVLAECGVTILFRRVSMKPGKPTLFGKTASGAAVFGLPGNPVSAFVSFELFVQPLLEARQGLVGRWPAVLQGRLVGSLKRNDDRQAYWPARLEQNSHGELGARALPWFGSGDPFGFCGANGLIVRPPQAEAASEGDWVRVMMLEKV